MSSGKMKFPLQAVFIVVLSVVALIYFTMPGRADDSCRGWVTEMVEDEGGPVLTTHACSDDATQTWLSMICLDGRLWLQFDMALGGEREPELDEEVAVEFVTDAGIETVPMSFQAMNAMFAGDVAADGRLVELLKAEPSVLIRDTAAAYPARTYSLKGSSAALSQLVVACG